MNYLPFAGYWFYGGANCVEKASFFSSWGLLDESPAGVPGIITYIKRWVKKVHTKRGRR